jgi:hypothetical protein
MSETKGRQPSPAATKGEEGKSAAETWVRDTGDAARQTAERLGEQTRDSIDRASAASTATASAAMRAGSTLAEGAQEITDAWVHYAEDVMRQTSEAGRAMVGCRSLTEMVEVQARLMRGSLQAFLDQGTRITEIAGRMAARPFATLSRVRDNQPQR